MKNFLLILTLLFSACVHPVKPAPVNGVEIGVGGWGSTTGFPMPVPASELKFTKDNKGWISGAKPLFIKPAQFDTFTPRQVKYSSASQLTNAVKQIATTITVPGKYRISFTGVLDIQPITIDTTATPPDTIKPPPVVVSGSAAKIGCNSFPWVPLSKFSDIGITRVRTYCPWHWVGRPDGSLFIEPMFQGYTNEAPGIDTYLSNAKSRGIDVLMCFNQCPEWLRPTGNGTGGNDYPPLPMGRNRLDPASYKEYAEFFYQIVCRYGSVKHPDSDLKVDITPQYPNQPTNQKKTGLGLIKYVEIGNELDHWFEGFGSAKYMQPEEQAAMLSAVYDAIKRADPNMGIVMGGITDLNLPYLKAMAAWAAKNRPGGTLPWDITNVHHYSNLGNRPGTLAPTWIQSGACTPDKDPAFSQIVDIVNWSSTYGKLTYVTEFGADTKTPSMMYVTGGEPAQAELITKSFQAYITAGVSAVYVYQAIDADGSADGGQFESSGIMTNKTDGYKPKAAYNAIKTLIQNIK